MSIAVQKIMSTCYMMMSPCQQGHRLGRVFNAVFTLVLMMMMMCFGSEDDKRPFDPELVGFAAPT